MPASRQAPPPSAKRPDLIGALRQALEGAGFTHEQVKAAMHSDDSLQIPPARAPLLLQELGGGPLATLIALFLAYVPVPIVFATRALAPLTLQQAEALGIVGLGRSHVHPQVQIQPTPEGWFASDILDESPEFVMGVSDSTRMLAHTTIRRPIESALDLGTGGGYHAILAAAHAQHVVGVDINPRAIAFAQFNAALNGCDNVEFRTGDMFEPVAGETFDLIVSNPPFVISPDRAFVYRDSSLGSDDVSRTLIQTMPRYLKPNGVGHVTFNWVHQANDSWDAPLREWVAGSGCDAWFIREASYDPLAYAMLWNQRLLVEPASKQRYAETIERWTRYFAHAGIRAIGYGLAILRFRPDAAEHRVRSEDMPPSTSSSRTPSLSWLQSSIGADLDRLIAADDQLEALSDTELLERRIAGCDSAHIQQTLRWRDGAYRLVDASLVSERGLRPIADLDPASALLLRRVDGQQTIRAVLDATGKALGRQDLDLLAFRESNLPVIRELISHGFLEFIA